MDSNEDAVKKTVDSIVEEFGKSARAVEAYQSLPGEEMSVDYGQVSTAAELMSTSAFWDEVSVDVTVRLPNGNSWTITETRKGDMPTEADVMDVLETAVESALFRQRSKVELESL